MNLGYWCPAFPISLDFRCGSAKGDRELGNSWTQSCAARQIRRVRLGGYSRRMLPEADGRRASVRKIGGHCIGHACRRSRKRPRTEQALHGRRAGRKRYTPFTTSGNPISLQHRGALASHWVNGNKRTAFAVVKPASTCSIRHEPRICPGLLIQCGPGHRPQLAQELRRRRRAQVHPL
jgi:hypothetical protein